MIELISITKEFDGKYALQGLTCKVEHSEIFGFIGPNGSGKTTTMRILATLLEPTSGDAIVNGHSVLKEPKEIKQFVGFMPDFFGIYDGLTVLEFLTFFAGAFKLPKTKRGKVINDVLTLVDLGERRNSYVETLSTGLRQRLCLAKTLLHDPMVLLLDEPAAGLDPRGRIELREILKTLRSLGKTIFISSHILPELADFCDKFGIIEDGKFIHVGIINETFENKTTRQIQIKYLGETASIIKILNKSRLVTDIAENEPVKSDTLIIKSSTFNFSGTLDDLADLVTELVSNKIRIVSLQEKEINLEDIFLSVTKGGVQL